MIIASKRCHDYLRQFHYAIYRSYVVYSLSYGRVQGLFVNSNKINISVGSAGPYSLKICRAVLLKRKSGPFDTAV